MGKTWTFEAKYKNKETTYITKLKVGSVRETGVEEKKIEKTVSMFMCFNFALLLVLFNFDQVASVARSFLKS